MYAGAHLALMFSLRYFSSYSFMASWKRFFRSTTWARGVIKITSFDGWRLFWWSLDKAMFDLGHPRSVVVTLLDLGEELGLLAAEGEAD